MKNGLKLISGFLFAAIMLTLLSSLSLADTIILKNGQSIEADKIDEREEDIIFYLHGLKMRVSKAGVVRIVKTSEDAAKAPSKINRKNVETKSHSNNPVPAEKRKKIDSQPSEKSSGTQSEENLTEIRWCGLRDLNWGTGRSTLGRLQELESETGQTEIKEYVRAKENLKMGNVQLDSIVYAFWRHRLYAITIGVSGHDNYLALRNEVFNRFGVGIKSDKNSERYLWSDTYSDRMLKYAQGDQKGLFWMRSKDLNRKYQLSQIKIPSTVIKAMEANALRAR